MSHRQNVFGVVERRYSICEEGENEHPLTPSDIEFSEVPSPLQFVDEFGDEGQWVFILHGDCIQGSVVLHESEGTIFLLDKEYWR